MESHREKPPKPLYPSIRTKRWDDPIEPGDGHRLLVTRYRPRGLSKADETWDAWNPNLGPSKQLHASVYGKRGLMQIPWTGYRAAYLREMIAQCATISDLAQRVLNGEQITLLCSSACTRESRCHRSVLKALIEAEMSRLSGKQD
jgi:uncharacterized protein YeaO (DUF488 family)